MGERLPSPAKQGMNRAEGMAGRGGSCPRNPEYPYVLAHIDLYSAVALGEASSRFAEKQKKPQLLGREDCGGLRQWRGAHFPVPNEVLDVIMAITQDFKLHRINRRALTSLMRRGKGACLLSGCWLHAKPLGCSHSS